MRKIKPRVKIVLYSLICVFCIFMSIKFLTTALIKSNLSVSVNSGSNIDYKVHLKENSYYEKSVLDSDMKYIASLIDYIDTNINVLIGWILHFSLFPSSLISTCLISEFGVKISFSIFFVSISK